MEARHRSGQAKVNVKSKNPGEEKKNLDSAATWKTIL
jgi:hypothetical protein